MATIRKLKKIAFPTGDGTAVFDSDDFVYSVNNIKPNVANGNVYIDRVNNANHSDAATKVDQKVSASIVTSTAYPNNATYVPDMSFLSYWNGAYSANNQSNLKYCYQGEIIGSSNIAQQSVKYANSCNKANFATTTDSAKNANHATNADHATNANHATTADSATNANHATNADNATNANHATTADTANRAYPRNAGGGNINFHWEGKTGQPTWLWGGEDGTNMYVYNPAAFSVNHALKADNADHATTADSAKNANHATTADSATNANHATTADSATNANHATTADTASRSTNNGSFFINGYEVSVG